MFYSDLDSTNEKLNTREFNQIPMIWTRTDYPRAVYNWSNDSNFPANYGSGFIIPGKDILFSQIIYITVNNLWIGKIYHNDYRIDWSQKL